MLNWPLLSQPANWLLVYLIVVIGMVAVTFVHQYMTGEGTSNNG